MFNSMKLKLVLRGLALTFVFLSVPIQAGRGSSKLSMLGIDVNSADENGTTVLMREGENGNLKAVRELIKNQADVNRKNKNGDTALIRAIEKGHWECAQFLLDSAAHIDHQNKNGSSALIIAIQNKHRTCVELLLKNRAAVNLQDNEGTTALMLAVESGNNEYTKLLLDHGADVNHENKNGYTALMLAANNGHTKCIQLLLDHGVNVNAVDGHWYSTGRNTALTYACAQNHGPAVAMLILAGADRTFSDWKAFTFAKSKHIRDLLAIQSYTNFFKVLTQEEYRACEQLIKLIPEDKQHLLTTAITTGVLTIKQPSHKAEPKDMTVSSAHASSSSHGQLPSSTSAARTASSTSIATTAVELQKFSDLTEPLLKNPEPGKPKIEDKKK